MFTTAPLGEQLIDLTPLTTMECIMPRRAQASIATASSIIIGIYIATLSPRARPEENVQDRNVTKFLHPIK